MRLCRRSVIASILLVTVLEGSAVEAQTSSNEPLQSQQPPGWLLTSSLGVGGSWDDNVLLLNSGSNPPGDYATPLDGGLTLDYRGRKLTFLTGYSGSFMMYRSLDELNSADHRARVHIEHKATPRLTLVFQDSFIQSPTTAGIEIEGVPFARIGSRGNEGGAGFEAIVARDMTLTGGYLLRTFAFDEQLGQNLQDGYEHVWRVALTRAFTQRLTLGARYELRREILSEGLDRFNNQTAGMSAEYELKRALTLSGFVGIATLGDGLTHDAQTGAAVEAGLAYKVKGTSLTAAYHRSFVPSFGFGGTFQNEGWLGSVEVPIAFISRRLYAVGNVNRQDNDPIVIGQPSLQTLESSAAVGYRLSSWANVEVHIARTAQENERPGGHLRRLEAGFRIFVTKPMRLR